MIPTSNVCHRRGSGGAAWCRSPLPFSVPLQGLGRRALSVSGPRPASSLPFCFPATGRQSWAWSPQPPPRDAARAPWPSSHLSHRTPAVPTSPGPGPAPRSLSWIFPDGPRNSLSRQLCDTMSSLATGHPWDPGGPAARSPAQAEKGLLSGPAHTLSSSFLAKAHGWSEVDQKMNKTSWVGSGSSRAAVWLQAKASPVSRPIWSPTAQEDLGPSA